MVVRFTSFAAAACGLNGMRVPHGRTSPNDAAQSLA